MRRALPPIALALCMPVLALLQGCDLFVLLVVAPFFPGEDRPATPSTTCPVLATAPGELPPLPDNFTVQPPVLPAQCAVGAPAIHRLNRNELTHSLSDVLGVDATVAVAAFPVDDVGGGFDNNASLLTVSPLFFEKLEQATRELVEQAMSLPGERSTTVVREAEYAIGEGSAEPQQGRYLVGAGSLRTMVIVQNAAGDYLLRARVGRMDNDTVKATLIIDGQEQEPIRVTKDQKDMQLIEVRAHLDAGPVHRLALKSSGGTLAVDFLEVEGPVAVDALGPPPPSRTSLVRCAVNDSSAGLGCARDAVRTLAQRAWRRSLQVDEGKALDALLDASLEAGDDAEHAMRTAMAAVLASPRFVYRFEVDGAGALRSTDAALPQDVLLDDVELAARLSYFVWSSTPDDRLLQLAARGALQDPSVLEGEVRRMLDDPRSGAFVESFSGQWLFARGLKSAAPDPERFPQFDEELRAAMQCETSLGFDRFLRDPSLSALDMIDIDSTFVNERLAQHYGVTPPSAQGTDTLGDGWGLVSLQGTSRAGVLTQGTLLTVTSQPTRTSPTRRGKWITENLLCEPPLVPPPGVEGMITEDVDQSGTVREQLEQHRENPECAGCHALMDPIGLALEHYDAVGRWRGSDQGFSIDDSGVWQGWDFAGPRELGAVLKQSPALPWCMSKKMLSYAVGRELGEEDGCLVDQLAERFAARDYRLGDLVVEVALSPGFRMRTSTGGSTP